MELFLVDVKSTVKINDKEVALDYINTYTDFITASNYAMSLTSDKTILDVSIHKWIMDETGEMKHSEDEPFPLYYYRNGDHPEYNTDSIVKLMTTTKVNNSIHRVYHRNFNR